MAARNWITKFCKREKTANFGMARNNSSQEDPSSAASEDSVMSFGSEDGNGSFSSINVVVRVRPLTMQEEGRKDMQVIQFPSEGQIQLEDPSSQQPRSFTFHVVFEPEATQDEVFDHCGLKKLIDMALDGFACTVLAYGQTGAGKTYTLTGPQSDDLLRPGERISPGIVHMAFAYLFNQIRQRKDVEYIVQASYMEIYKEQVLDLLNPSTKALNVRWCKDKGFYAENLFVVECEDSGDLEGVLDEGRKNRQVRSHNMNEHSSRSHTMLILMLTSEFRDPEDPTHFIRRYGKLFLVDLAGSEKTKKTNSRGETLKEANNINKSLLVLGNCISALADPRKRSGHIPYRDSTLTKLLADSLGGSGLALMIACVSPSRTNVSETLNTLRYASRAKRIRTKPMVRMDPREQLIMSLKREVRVLRMENSFLRQQLHLDNGLVTSNKGAGLRRPVEVEDMPADEVQSMLKQYMNENETLREENAELRFTNDLLTRELERVNKENERLQKDRTRSAFSRRKEPINTTSRAVLGSSDSIVVQQDNSSSTSGWGTGNWRSIIDVDKEIEHLNDVNNNNNKPANGVATMTNNKNIKSVNKSEKAIVIKGRGAKSNAGRLNPSKRKVGKSMGDITATDEQENYNSREGHIGRERQRRRTNSWGSGIPQPVNFSRRSRSPPKESYIREDGSSSSEGAVRSDTPSKLPPLLSMLMPKTKRNSKISSEKRNSKDPIDGAASTLAKDLEQVQKAIRGESRATHNLSR